MAKPRLTIARPPRKPTFALLRKALMLFRGEGVPRELARRNAIAWLKSMRELGDRHILKGSVLKGNILRGREAAWGEPGDGYRVGQIRAPRVSGERT
jgi:hypothetical protein